LTIYDDLTIALAAVALIATAVTAFRGYQPSSTARSRVLRSLRRSCPLLDDLFWKLTRADTRSILIPIVPALAVAIASPAVLTYLDPKPGISVAFQVLNMVALAGLYLQIFTPTAGSPGRLADPPVSDAEMKRVARISVLYSASLLWILFAALGCYIYLSGTITTSAELTQALSNPKNQLGLGAVIFEMALVVIYGSRKVRRMTTPALERNIKPLGITARISVSNGLRPEPIIIEGTLTGLADVLRVDQTGGWTSEIEWADVRRLDILTKPAPPDDPPQPTSRSD
jgi:hypothetical protein